MAITHKIRVQWGYWTVYIQEAYMHPDYCWDGSVRVEGGEIHNCGLLEFGGIFGPCRERVIPLDRPQWHWHVDYAYNQMGGVVFEVEGGPEAVVHVSTRTVDMRFSLEQLLAEKVIRQPVGPRYCFTNLIAMLDDHDPALDDPEEIIAGGRAEGICRRLIPAKSFGDTPVQRWYRSDWAWVAPGSNLDVHLDRPDWSVDNGPDRRVLRVVYRCASAHGTKADRVEEAWFDPNASAWSVPYHVSLNGREIDRGEQYFSTMHFTPLMQELVVDVPGELLDSDKNKLVLHNDADGEWIGVTRLFLEEVWHSSIDICHSPKWVVLGEPFEIGVKCHAVQTRVRVEVPTGIEAISATPGDLSAGEHRFEFRVDEPLVDATIAFISDQGRSEAVVEQVVAVQREAMPMRVGMETKLHSIDIPDEVESVLREMKQDQLGNWVVFRFAKSNEQVAHWARMCNDYGIYHLIEDEWAEVMQREGGAYFVGRQFQEFDGTLWGFIRPNEAPVTPLAERTMKTACEDYLAYMSDLVSKCGQNNPDVTPVESISAIGHDLAYRAGMAFCISQFNKTNNVLLLADARGAARTHGKELWGCYMAEGAHKSPEHDEILRMWWLAIHLAYVCGSSAASDEECLMRNYHERLYAKGDRFPRTRRDILRRFNRFAKTHPRRGQLRVKQAVLIGQYACDITDGMSDSEHKGSPRTVWRTFGGDTAAWQQSTAEYGLRYLDVFFPGVWLQGLVQNPQRVRRWYAGTPHGEAELIPIEAPLKTLDDFDLLLLLGWNTMTDPIYRKLGSYVEGGGRLFMSVPHLTTNETRDFLWQNMEPLNLLHEGDFEDLFGVRITGRGKRMSTLRFTDDSRAPFRPIDYPPPAAPKHAPVDLMNVELCGAEVVAVDHDSGQPVLVRHRRGKGEAYLLLTHDFPGNSWLSPFMTALVRRLATETPSSVVLNDPSGEVYYTVREEPETGLVRVHLLNTDWTQAGQERDCTLRLGDHEVRISLREGRLSEVIWTGDLAVLVEDERVFVDTVTTSATRHVLTLHGFGNPSIKVQSLEERTPARFEFEGLGLETDSSDGWSQAQVPFTERSVGNLTVG